ncbi:Zinc finger, CCHC-type, partial [Parasponia andersonii]
MATTCEKCRKTHSGKCRMESNLCFKYGKSGHFIKDCKENQTIGGNSGQKKTQ